MARHSAAIPAMWYVTRNGGVFAMYLSESLAWAVAARLNAEWPDDGRFTVSEVEPLTPPPTA
jgi:hypothetical protein